MKLLFVVGMLGIGGAEKHTLDLAKALANRGHICIIASMRAYSGLPLQNFNSIDIKFCNAQGFLDMNAARVLSSLILLEEPDVVIGVNQYALMYSHIAKVIAQRSFRIATVFHTTKLRRIREHVLLVLYKFLVRHTNLLVFVSELQAQFWSDRGLKSKRDAVINNGINVEQFSPVTIENREASRSRYGIAPSDFLIGITAAFRPEKNHIFLLRALHEMRSNFIPAKLIFVGDGPLKESLMQEAAALGVSDYVVFAGAQNDVKPLVAAFDVFALVSTGIETFSLAALEAMAMGIPAVLSDVGGAREMVVDGETGFVFQTNDMNQFMAAMNTLRAPDTARVMGMAAHRFVNARFTHKAMVDRYEQLFGALVPQGRG